MSYKYLKGSQIIGDLKAADDTQRDTLIDFGEDYIGLETSGSLRMVISGSDGKVGIGVAAPSYKLDINGDIRIRGNDIRDTYQMIFFMTMMVPIFILQMLHHLVEVLTD